MYGWQSPDGATDVTSGRRAPSPRRSKRRAGNQGSLARWFLIELLSVYCIEIYLIGFVEHATDFGWSSGTQLMEQQKQTETD